MNLLWFRPLVCTLFCALLSACAGPQSAPQDASVPYEVLNRRESFVLAPAITRVVIRNAHGDVRVRASDRREVGVYGVIQRIGSQPLDPSFVTEQTADSFILTMRYPGEEQWAVGDHRRGRVDLGVWLPADVRIEVQTSDGLVQVKRAQQALRVRTDSGRIEVSVRGDLDVESVSGNIMARQINGQWNGVARIVSSTGDIVAAIPPFADVHLVAQAGGTLSTDPGLPAAITKQAAGMAVDARFGTATHELQLRTDGNIYLLPVIRDPKDTR